MYTFSNYNQSTSSKSINQTLGGILVAEQHLGVIVCESCDKEMELIDTEGVCVYYGLCSDCTVSDQE